MTIRYPKEMACILEQGFKSNTNTFLNRTVFTNGQSRNRSRYSSNLTILDLSFVMMWTKLFDWQLWVNRHAYDWFFLDTYSPKSSGVEGDLVEHRLRFISDLSIEPVTIDWVKVSLKAELDPNYRPIPLIDFTGDWYIAGSPPSPATANLIRARTPAAPATAVIVSGTPQFPAA